MIHHLVSEDSYTSTCVLMSTANSASGVVMLALTPNESDMSKNRDVRPGLQPSSLFPGNRV